MNIIITMAGEGSRFKKQGINEEKWRLTIKDKTMFEWSMLSLKDFFNEKFIFIARESHHPRDFIEEKCENLGISDFEILEISEKTDGQATTALLAEGIIPENESIAIYNIDTYVEDQEILKSEIKEDGCIPVFEAEGEKWSFVKTDENGNVTEVAEKERISSLATLGFYYFDKFEEFKTAFKETSETVKQKYGEKYVAPLYQWYIDQDKEISIQKVDADKIHVLGTPEDVIEFWPKFESLYL